MLINLPPRDRRDLQPRPAAATAAPHIPSRAELFPGIAWEAALDEECRAWEARGTVFGALVALAYGASCWNPPPGSPWGTRLELVKQGATPLLRIQQWAQDLDEATWSAIETGVVVAIEGEAAEHKVDPVALIGLLLISVFGGRTQLRALIYHLLEVVWVLRPDLGWCPSCGANAKIETAESHEPGLAPRWFCLSCGLHGCFGTVGLPDPEPTQPPDGSTVSLVHGVDQDPESISGDDGTGP